MPIRAPIITYKRARKLRRSMSPPEAILWRCLRGSQLAHLRFRRQHPIGPYILDLYCAAAKLCVEVDGASHDFVEVVAHDERRTRWLAGKGIRVLRVMAVDVFDPRGLEGVLAWIKVAAAEFAAAPSTGSAGPPPP